MTRPTFPLICIDNVQIDIISKAMTKAVASALVNSAVFKDSIYFDKNGEMWTSHLTSEQFKNTPVSRFLAKSFIRNPLVEVEQHWKNIGKYSIEELKARINSLVDKDDDLITQFEEGHVIKDEINNSNSFENLVKVVKKYIPKN